MISLNIENLKKSKINFDDKIDRQNLTISYNETKLITAEDVNNIKKSVNNSIDLLILAYQEFLKTFNDIDLISSLIDQYSENNITVSAQLNIINNKINEIDSNLPTLNLLKEQLDEVITSGWQHVNTRLLNFKEKYKEISNECYILRDIYNNYYSLINERLNLFEKTLNEDLISNNIDFSDLDNEYKNHELKITDSLSGINLSNSTINNLLLSAETMDFENINELDEFLEKIKGLQNNADNI